MFADKTGTLTRNVMRFKKCSVAGIIYGKDDDAQFSDRALVENLSSRHVRKRPPTQFKISGPLTLSSLVARMPTGERQMSLPASLNYSGRLRNLTNICCDGSRVLELRGNRRFDLSRSDCDFRGASNYLYVQWPFHDSLCCLGLVSL